MGEAITGRTQRIAGLDLLRGLTGAAIRTYAVRLAQVPTAAAPVALASLVVLSVVPLRGNALTYLAGGPAIAVLTAVQLLTWGRRTIELPVERLRQRVPVTA